MNILEFTLLILLCSFFAGFLSSLTGLGGGVVIVPLLALAFGVDVRYAIGASLVSVIATSSGAAAAYVKEGFSNIRVGMFLEIATTTGAVIGAFLAARISTGAIAVVFGLVLLHSAWLSVRARRERPGADRSDPLAVRLRMDGSFPTPEGRRSYHIHRVPLGFALMFVAGGLSGLLGIGSGAIKVLAMDRAMRIPFKVSTTTSNFMIGVTAAAAAGALLRIQASSPFLLHWTGDEWLHSTDTRSRSTGVGIEFVDILLPQQNAPIRFTFLWVEDNRWEGKDYKIEIQSKTLVAAGD